MAKAESLIPKAKIARYERLVATHPDVEVKGAKARYTSLNGHMFSFLTETGALALRFSTEEQEAFMEKHRAKPCIQHGSVMKGYALVPEALWKKPAVLKKAFAASHACIAALKPKPTTRKKAARKTTKKKAARKRAR